MSGTITKLNSTEEAELNTVKCNWLCANKMQCGRKVEFRRKYMKDETEMQDYFCEYHMQLLLQSGEVQRV